MLTQKCSIQVIVPQGEKSFVSQGKQNTVFHRNSRFINQKLLLVMSSHLRLLLLRFCKIFQLLKPLPLLGLLMTLFGCSPVRKRTQSSNLAMRISMENRRWVSVIYGCELFTNGMQQGLGSLWFCVGIFHEFLLIILAGISSHWTFRHELVSSLTKAKMIQKVSISG